MIDINVKDLCPECIAGAMLRPAEEMKLFGYFLFASLQEISERGEVPELSAAAMLAIKTAAQYKHSLTWPESSMFDARFREELGYVEEATEEAVIEATFSRVEHPETRPEFIN